MTASELAARKKELSEKFTLEELIEMYLASEHTSKETLKEYSKLEKEASSLREKVREYESERDDELDRLNAAFDVVMEKYVALKQEMES